MEHKHPLYPESGPAARHSNASSPAFTLLEVMVAMLLLTIASAMIYSMLNRAIFFTDRGEIRSRAMEEQYALLSLLQRQIHSGWFNPLTQQVLISGETNLLRLATTTPFQAGPGRVVMVFYRYNPEEKTLYYLEKKDFYNSDYIDLIPAYTDMTALLTTKQGLGLDFDNESNTVTITCNKRQYTFQPWCGLSLSEDADG